MGALAKYGPREAAAKYDTRKAQWPYIKLLEFAYKSSSVSQLQNWALCKPSLEPKSVNSPKK